MHLKPNHHFLYCHHLINSVISLISHRVTRLMIFQSEYVTSAHVLGEVPVIGVAVRSIEIFDNL